MSTIQIDVEFEDIDAGGVVYHANYIRLCDRARNRWLAEYGVTFGELKNKDVALVIRAIKADYLRPVNQEPVNIKMTVMGSTEKSMTILHQIFPHSSQNRVPHFSAEIVLVAANYSTGRSCILPDEVKRFVEEVRSFEDREGLI